MTRCAGCNRDFTVSGYSQHIAKTTRSVCLAAFRAEVEAQDEIERNRHRDREPHTDAASRMNEDSLDNEQVEVGIGDAINNSVHEDEGDEEHGEMIELVQTRHLIQVPSEDYSLTGAVESPLRIPDDHDVEQFPGKQAGAPAPTSNQPGFNVYQRQLDSSNEYSPFLSKREWELAKWAKTCGVLPVAITELLQTVGVAKRLGLSYKNVRELNTLIDEHLPGRPQFHEHQVRIADENITVYSRNVIECLEALYGDPAFTRYLIHKPERHYTRSGTPTGERRRVYHDMHTRNWWWEIQHVLEARKPGATVMPVIVSMDQTQVTLSGRKKAYPLYLTIGNLIKATNKASLSSESFFTFPSTRALLLPSIVTT